VHVTSTIWLLFDCNSTTLPPVDDLRYVTTLWRCRNSIIIIIIIIILLSNGIVFRTLVVEWS